MWCVSQSFDIQTGLIISWFPVACPVDDSRDVSSGSETDSDLEDEEDGEGLEVAGTYTLKSL